MAKSKKSKEIKEPQFNISSTRFCEECKNNVRIGLGGEANWDTHLRSASHKDNMRRMAALPKKTLLSFFNKKEEISSATESNTQENTALPLVLRPSELLTVKFSHPTVHISQEINHSLAEAGPHHILPGNSTSGLLARFKAVIESLPDSVPLGTVHESMGAFSGNPSTHILQGDDAWETIDRMLNRVFGYGVAVEQLTSIITRGPFGMDGMYNWVKVCIEELKIDEVLLDGKVQRLIDAMLLLGANLAHIPPPSAKEHPQNHSTTSIERERVAPTLFKAQCSTAEVSCPGYTLKISDSQSPFASYPFLLHTIKSLPWKVVVSSAGVILYSNQCTGSSQSTKKGKELRPIACFPCSRLHDDTIIMGIRHRLLDGAHENTPWAYLTPAEMYTSLEKKDKQFNNLKLRSLNNAVTIGVRNRHLDGWKRLAMAIGKEDIPRIRSLMAAQTRAGASVFSIIEKVDKAATRKYSPRGYNQTDFERAFLIYKLGGRSAANIAHKALGIPSIDATKRHIATKPLQASSGFPSAEELAANLNHCYPLLPLPSLIEGTFPILPMSIQIDEIKVQERLRWDPRTNHILGVCREHGGACALEFRSIVQADAVADCLRKNIIHFSSEATVIGSSILTADPNEYTTKSFAISGSCKRETVHDQERLLRQVIESLRKSQQNFNRRLYCVASDGDSRRRRALIQITLTGNLDPSDPIYHLLSPLPLFDLKCGNDALTSDFDWKHVLKRFRNTAIRPKGFNINGNNITAAVIKSHLLSIGMSEVTADTVLAPNDKQDVMLMIKLLYAITTLPSVSTANRVLAQSTRDALRLVGRVYCHLLNAYLDTTLSLHQQLQYLSAAVHLILALYNQDKGDFIPVQTYFDVMSMVKNVYFCVAKAQHDNPTGLFFIILLGTDGLEKTFGKVRSMVGNDTNADLLQLANRIDGAVHCVNILEIHPEWGGEARRLRVGPLQGNSMDLSSKYDHINPHSWKGDVRVNQVVLLGSWNGGRRVAEGELKDAGISPPFERMAQEGGYNILCPFGNGKMILVDGLRVGERDETEEELDLPVVTLLSDQPSVNLDVQEEEPDIDDLAGTAELLSLPNDSPPVPYVSIDMNNPEAKKAHKASVLRLYSSPLTITESRDRLKRVRGFSRYDETKGDNMNVDPSVPEEEDGLYIQDPAVTLVRCDKRLYMAIFQVLGIRRDGKEIQSLPSRFISEPNIRIQGQLMKLSLISHSQESAHQIDSPDWEWNGGFEARAVFRDLEGRFVQQINPDRQRASRGRNVGEDTFVFRSAELRAICATMYERLHKETNSFPHAPLSDSFPYRSAAGQACFVCERDSVGGDLRHVDGSPSCPCCPNVRTNLLGGQDLLKHMGAHILHDSSLKGANNPCGLCLNTGSLCEIRLIRRGDTTSIDSSKSRCQNLRQIKVKLAKEFTKNQPCTNHPLICPLCSQTSPAVWKYNLKAHILLNHPSARVDLYEPFYRLHADEWTLMKGVFLTRTRSRPSKRSDAPTLTISDGHSSRLALRDIREEAQEEVDYIGNDDERELEGPEPTSGDSDSDEGVDPPSDWEAPDTSSVLVPEPINPGSATTCDGQPQAEVAPETSQLISENDEPPSPAAGTRPHRKRKITQVLKDMIDSRVCADEGCETEVDDCELLRCDACKQVVLFKYHLTCRGQLEIPTGGWFCDDECKKNGGGRAVSGRKRRRTKNMV